MSAKEKQLSEAYHNQCAIARQWMDKSDAQTKLLRAVPKMLDGLANGPAFRARIGAASLAKIWRRKLKRLGLILTCGMMVLSIGVEAQTNLSFSWKEASTTDGAVVGYWLVRGPQSGLYGEWMPVGATSNASYNQDALPTGTSYFNIVAVVVTPDGRMGFTSLVREVVLTNTPMLRMSSESTTNLTDWMPFQFPTNGLLSPVDSGKFFRLKLTPTKVVTVPSP
jgi:hypothetical protein